MNLPAKMQVFLINATCFCSYVAFKFDCFINMTLPITENSDSSGTRIAHYYWHSYQTRRLSGIVL